MVTEIEMCASQLTGFYTKATQAFNGLTDEILFQFHSSGKKNVMKCLKCVFAESESV